MAVQLTRKQYEELYGSKPVFVGSDSTFEPTPVRMTQDEYNRLYPKPEYQAPRGLRIKETALAGIEDIKTGLNLSFGGSEAATAKENIFDEGLAKGTLETLFRGLRTGADAVVGLGRTVGAIAQVGLAPILGPINIVGEKIGETTGRALPIVVGSAAEATAKNPLVMQALEDILDLSNLAVPEIAARGAKALEPVQKAIEIKLQSGELTPPQVKTFVENRVSAQALKDLQDLKTKNAKLRNNTFFDDSSIKRISDAQAKTGFLNNATDVDGTIRTKDTGIAQKYRELTIDGADGVVRQLLKQEGSKVNIEEIGSAMRVAADLKYEGADLVNSLRGIEKELAGLRKRADEFGDIPLDKVQDMKIASTQYVDYTNPAEASFKKLKGSVYRQIIEDKSSTTIEVGGKQRTIKDINAELQKYYRDIENLEALDGLKVRGGRLGKYFSQTIGALVGSSAGQVAGPLGAAVGGIIGAEAGGAIRGAQLSRAFGRGRAGDLAPNTLLQKAKDAGKKEAVVDLRKPDVKVGVPSNIPKTKEIRQVEAQITKNVEAQKKAILGKNFTLVATLKEVYKALVEKLKELIQKASTGTARGFARIDLGQSKSEGSRKNIQANTNGNTKNSIDGNSTTAFKGFTDLSTKLLEKLKGRTTVSRQFIEDLTNSPDLKQSERDLIRRVLNDTIEGNGQGASQVSPLSQKTTSRTIPRGVSTVGEVGKKQRSQEPVGGKLYTGGPKGIKEFNPTKGDLNDALTYGDGLYLTPDRKIAESYAGKTGQVYEVNANLKNPLEYPPKNEEEWLSFIQQPTSAKKAEWLKKRGYDGVVDVSEEYKQVLVVDPKQVTQISDQISVPDFANKVKSELLPLDTKLSDRSKNLGGGQPRYESINLPAELRGPVANYEERVYQSPINTSGGSVHFSTQDYPGYFAHTRIEDLPDKTTRRVIEAQSDLFQKGRLEEEFPDKQYNKPTPQKQTMTLPDGRTMDFYGKSAETAKREKDLAKLEPYRDTWHERVIREEVKQAAKDGKTKLQFPTGETAMKIEGLGETANWLSGDAGNYAAKLMPEDLKVGSTIFNQGGNQANRADWIITDVLGDGKFKAVPKEEYSRWERMMRPEGKPIQKDLDRLEQRKEQFDISGKVDTNNPIYKFYEKKVGKYLKNKYGATPVTDAQGVKWMEIDLKGKGFEKVPVEAFGVGALPLLDQEDTNK